MASTQDAIITQDIGKPLVKATRPIPTPNASELLVKVTVAGRKYSFIPPSQKEY